MLLYSDFAIKIIFSILFLSSTGNDNKSKNAEHGFVSSSVTNSNIVSDVNQVQSKLEKFITVYSFAGSCPINQTLKKNNSLFELYNLTDQTKKQNLSAVQENLRLFAETSSDSNHTGIGLKAQAFFNESINYIFGLTKCQKFFIAVSYLLALWKLHGARLRSIIFKVPCKLFGKPKKTTLRKISTCPSEKTTIARDEHMNADDETTGSSCDSKIDADEQSTNLSCDELVNTDDDSVTTTSSSVEDLPTSTNKQIIPPTIIQTQQKYSPTFSSSDSSSEESSSKEDFPDEFFVFPGDDGNIRLILGDENWEKIELDSSRESLYSDDCGNVSTGIESGESYVDSRASSQSSCYSPVSCSSHGDPVTVVTTRGCDDWIEESYQGIVDVDQWTLESGDNNNCAPCNGSTSNVDHGEEWTCYSSYDSDVISEGYEDSIEIYQGEYSDHGSSVERSIDIENESVQENIMQMRLEQRVKNHAVAAAIFAGTFALPCCIAAKLLK